MEEECAAEDAAATAARPQTPPRRSEGGFPAFSFGSQKSSPHRRRGSVVDEVEAARIQRMALSIGLRPGSELSPWLQKCLRQAAPFLDSLCRSLDKAWPPLYNFIVQVVRHYRQLPKHVLGGLWGLAICFFGGRYTVTIAAIEAFKASGGSEVMECIEDLGGQLRGVQAAMQHVGTRDSIVRVTSGTSDPKAVLWRKISLILRTVDPDVLQDALGRLWAGYMGVLAVVKFRFAQTFALTHSIGDSLRPIAAKTLGPTLLSMTPPEYQNWVSPSINLACKMLAGLLAWRVRRLLSTVQCGVSGGLQAMRALLQVLRERKLVQIPDDVNSTLLDEVGGYSLAAFGIYYQIARTGMRTPLLLAPMFWPLDALEWWLQWSVKWLGTESLSQGTAK
eukprot:TRINITY_DN50648_c0_g1_i1.p1 TRINITY_DN50648_c0_g1~~TRINITY_DN50648_c0_g1_i1.p1  ORF type:complete len:421 (+),score=63.68 TRINITY_DN50648_c0_g1_i1:91-1263(+)